MKKEKWKHYLTQILSHNRLFEKIKLIFSMVQIEVDINIL